MGFGAHLSLVGKSAGVAPAPALTVASVSPSTGPSSGGTTVTISGTGFESGMVVVFFTEDESYVELAADLVFVSSTTLTCKTPPGVSGAVWVGVGVIGDWEARHAFLVDGFTFTSGATPVLMALDYDQANHAGGEQVTIFGEHLSGATSCEVGGSGTGETWTPATILANTSDSITITVPAKSAGMHSVRVTTASGTSNGLSIEAWSPALLNAASWCQAPFVLPWAGSASAGDSASKLLMGIGGTSNPAVGSPVNGYALSEFDGVNDKILQHTGNAAEYFAASGYSNLVLARPKSPPAKAGSIYDNPHIAGGAAGSGAIVWSTDGVTAYHYQGTYPIPPWIPCTPNEWHALAQRYDGSRLSIALDGVAKSSTPASNVLNFTGDYYGLGQNYSTVYTHQDVLETITLQEGIDDATWLKVIKYWHCRYRISFAPALAEDQADAGDTVVILGVNLQGASVSLDGVPVTLTVNTSSKIGFTMPSKTSGVYDVEVEPLSGGSFTLGLRAWAPTPEYDTAENVTLCFDSKHTPYNGTTGVWEPRFNAIVADSYFATNPVTGAVHHAADDGAPVFDGDGTSEPGLVQKRWFELPGPSATFPPRWADFLSNTVDHLGVPIRFGSIAMVLSHENTETLTIVGPVYDNPMAIGSMHNSSGTIGIFTGKVSGVSSVGTHLHTVPSGYNAVHVPAAAGDLHAVVSRWDDQTLDLSVGGALSGSGYASVVAAGTTAQYTDYPIYLGTKYNASSASQQTFKGTERAFCILKAKASDVFIQRFAKWARVRHGVAA
ncbi:MAG: IPT/TIG domain-containing protein [Labilithrix sp.]|nr:IPT/TIG domain-containing protein [Labilithrix sp.]